MDAFYSFLLNALLTEQLQGSLTQMAFYADSTAETAD